VKLASARNRSIGMPRWRFDPQKAALSRSTTKPSPSPSRGGMPPARWRFRVCVPSETRNASPTSPDLTAVLFDQ
jgi:hypothetical protein